VPDDQLSRRSFVARTAAAAGLASLRDIALAQNEAESRKEPVTVRPSGTVLDLEIGGKPFAVYNFDTDHAGNYRPYFYPVMGPNGRPITQQGEFPGSLRGHYWHRSLFVAHQQVNGISFWEERKADCGRMVHLAFSEITSGQRGRFVERLAWRDLEGEDLVLETRTVEIPASPSEVRLLDIAIDLHAARNDVELAATPYNLLACRVIDAMCRIDEKREYTRRYGPLVDFSPMDQGGRITNSEGQQDDDCRGARARWCDFSGPLGDGGVGGIAILDHPSNPRHPTPWHNWNNMTITASFTFHEPFTLKRDQHLALTYRIAVHPGTAAEANVESLWNEFAATHRVE
jgi:hypothetical protein